MNNYIVFDIGGSSVKWSVINGEGQIGEGGKINIPETIEEFFKNIANVTNEMKEKNNVVGIAISAPGAVDPETGLIGGASAVPYIHGPNFKVELKALTGLNVEIENDANCAALGECWIGAAKDNNDSAFVVCGTGIGGALIKDKHVHRGIHQHGGEFGYCIMSYDMGAERPYKTWSEVGSTGALARNTAKRKGLAHGEINGADVFRMSEEGDQIAIEEINKFYSYMANGLFNIQFHYDPEVIVIGGAISERPEFIDEINKRLDILFTYISDAKVRPVVKSCEYGNDANKLGALYNYLQRNRA